MTVDGAPLERGGRLKPYVLRFYSKMPLTITVGSNGLDAHSEMSERLSLANLKVCVSIVFAHASFQVASTLVLIRVPCYFNWSGACDCLIEG